MMRRSSPYTVPGFAKLRPPFAPFPFKLPVLFSSSPSLYVRILSPSTTRIICMNKYDGFRALAVIESGRCKLVSRNGNEFKAFALLASSIGSTVRGSAVLDGEVVCLDENGYPRFNDLLFHRLEPCFVAFDILSLNGKDLRWNALVERKAELRRLLGLKQERSRKRRLSVLRVDMPAGFRRHCRKVEARALHE